MDHGLFGENEDDADTTWNGAFDDYKELDHNGTSEQEDIIEEVDLPQIPKVQYTPTEAIQQGESEQLHITEENDDGSIRPLRAEPRGSSEHSELGSAERDPQLLEFVRQMLPAPPTGDAPRNEGSQRSRRNNRKRSRGDQAPPSGPNEQRVDGQRDDWSELINTYETSIRDLIKNQAFVRHNGTTCRIEWTKLAAALQPKLKKTKKKQFAYALKTSKLGRELREEANAPTPRLQQFQPSATESTSTSTSSPRAHHRRNDDNALRGGRRRSGPDDVRPPASEAIATTGDSQDTDRPSLDTVYEHAMQLRLFDRHILVNMLIESLPKRAADRS
jgi:hypothetical protein